MSFIKILVVFIMMVQPIYAEVEVIEWGNDSSESYSVNSSNAQVDIYVTSWCPYCKKAIGYLDSNGIEYNKYDIEEDLDATERKKKIAPNYRGVPLAVINGKIIKGFGEKRYLDALEN